MSAPFYMTESARAATRILAAGEDRKLLAVRLEETAGSCHPVPGLSAVEVERRELLDSLVDRLRPLLRAEEDPSAISEQALCFRLLRHLSGWHHGNPVRLRVN